MPATSRLSVDSVEIERAVSAWNAALERGARTGWRGHAKHEGRRYIYLDEEVNGDDHSSGRFLIDKNTGDIYPVAAYGKRKGGAIMNLTDWYSYWARL